jgi:alginate O-acetyltransferase complex protein AlgI
MLFNSYVFIFAFLPVVFFGFYFIGQYSHKLALLWLTLASLFFYAWWDVRFVGLLLGSIVFNYGFGYLIGQKLSKSTGSPNFLLVSAIVANMVLLGYFKYANFFVENLNQLAGTSILIGEVFLPLGISFFTFTQIAFLVDTCQGKAREYSFIHYTLFVTYFPHLIAGPILHHKEMMPQFARDNTCVINLENIAVGLSIFVLGLVKKVLIADSIADIASPIFDAVSKGGHPMLFESWTGALAYTLQLYFDFSAYSDMAIGLSLMFNVRLPLNFNSPYKATSIIEFWRCWHMTLSRFLRDYLYIPLGGSRHGKSRRYFNLMVTMLLGGLWHGAGWTFVIWGGLHGFYLMINHAWRNLKQIMGWGDGGKWSNLAAGTLTFLAVVVGWVFFRADSFSSAATLLQGMIGINGFSLPEALSGWWDKYPDYFPHQEATGLISLFTPAELNALKAIATLISGFVIIWGFPNMRQLFRHYRPVCEDFHKEAMDLTVDTISPCRFGFYFEWKPVKAYAWLIGAFFALAILGLTHVSEFLYFQF